MKKENYSQFFTDNISCADLAGMQLINKINKGISIMCYWYS